MNSDAILIVALVLYFLPWFIASKRDHPNETAIALLNLFLGWTFLGWVAALVWAATSITPSQELPKYKFYKPPRWW